MDNADHNIYLKHIQEAIDKIERYIDGLNYEQFSKNDMAIDAVVRELEIIGEAATKVSDQFQEANPNIPWTSMIGMRNQLIHGYFAVDTRVVWQTCNRDLMELKSLLSDSIYIGLVQREWHAV